LVVVVVLLLVQLVVRRSGCDQPARASKRRHDITEV
jgi:hypothetical protein